MIAETELATLPFQDIEPEEPRAADDRGTPWEVFTPLNDEFAFTLDACASAQNAKVSNYYTKEQDALTLPWPGRVWINPPYGVKEIMEWLDYGRLQAMIHNGLVVFLLPVSSDTDWWARFAPDAHEIRFYNGRIRFEDTNGSPRWPSCLFIWDFRPYIIRNRGDADPVSPTIVSIRCPQRRKK